jgi:uncharacterized membrane protein
LAEQLRPVERERLNALVDSAFAFAATLLVFGQAGAMQSYADLQVSLLNVPAFALGFFILIGFWWAHRSISMLQDQPDPVSDAISVAITFLVMVFIFPVSFLTEALAHWASNGTLPGRGLYAGQTRNAYLVFGLGFGTLSGLYFWLYQRLVAARNRDKKPTLTARKGRRFWIVACAAAILSITVTYVASINTVIWLPLLPYAALAVSALPVRVAKPTKSRRNLKT